MFETQVIWLKYARKKSYVYFLTDIKSPVNFQSLQFILIVFFKKKIYIGGTNDY